LSGNRKNSGLPEFSQQELAVQINRKNSGLPEFSQQELEGTEQ